MRPVSNGIRATILLGATVVFGFWVPIGASAPPANPECWGVVTAQRASTAHDVGTHAAAQSEPRLGLGNVAQAFTGTHQPGQLGSLLATLDDLSATECP
jgi:hypothetical protein